MACQSNPKTYSFVVRCPLEDGAALKSLADDVGKTVSAYVAKMVRLHIGDRNLNEKEKLWVSQHLEANLIRRAKADEKTANGYYKRKRRGRPRKPGPKKGWKKHKSAISDGLMSAKPGLIDLDVARSYIKQAERHVELRKYLPDVADRVYDDNMKRNRRAVFERLSKMAGEYLKLEKMRREQKS